MMRFRVLISLANGAASPATWRAAALQEPPVRGKPVACRGCPLRVGGEWDAGATETLATAPETTRRLLRRRWGCHAAERPCAGMARVLSTGEE